MSRISAFAVLIALAIAVAAGHAAPGAAHAAGSLVPRTEVDAPIITPTGGHYGANVSVMISIRSEPDSRIVYTLDGTYPEPGGRIQTESNLAFVELPAGDVTVRAIAVRPGLPPSRTAKATFTRSVPAKPSY